MYRLRDIDYVTLKLAIPKLTVLSPVSVETPVTKAWYI